MVNCCVGAAWKRVRMTATSSSWPTDASACTVAEEFLPAMEGILARVDPPDHIVIETSGLALPQPLVRAFNWPEIRNRVTVDAVVALTDAAALASGKLADDEVAVEERRRGDALLDHDTPLGELFEDQLGERRPAAAEQDRPRAGRRENPARGGIGNAHARGSPRDRFLVLPCTRGHDLRDRRGARSRISRVARSDITITRRRGTPKLRSLARGTITGTMNLSAFALAIKGVDDPDALAARIREAMRRFEIYRVKGFGAVGDRPLRAVFQAAGPRTEYYFDRLLRDEEAKGVELVVIGKSGLDQKRRGGGSVGLMHLLAAQAGAPVESGEPVDLGQEPADIVFLSAADTELAALSAARQRLGEAGRFQRGQSTTCESPEFQSSVHG